MPWMPQGSATEQKDMVLSGVLSEVSPQLREAGPLHQRQGCMLRVWCGRREAQGQAWKDASRRQLLLRSLLERWCVRSSKI